MLDERFGVLLKCGMLSTEMPDEELSALEGAEECLDLSKVEDLMTLSTSTISSSSSLNAGLVGAP